MFRHKILFMTLCVMLTSCVENGEREYTDYGVSSGYTVTRSPISGWCSINVKNESTGAIKTVDMETDYVPNVTHCENGGAPYQALRSQAVAARSFAYYKLGSSGTAAIRDSTNDQVYSCPSRAPNEAQFARMLSAANDTNGIVLRRGNTQICAFFRAGSKEKYLDSNCMFTGGSGAEGYGGGQGAVTYNWGRSGSDLIKSSSGSKSSAANSGCYSQNGAMCLARKGWVWENILKFFYGMDIGIVRVEAACVTHPKCTIQLDGGSTIIDESSECFTRKVSDNYYALGVPFGSSAEAVGHDGTLLYAYTGDQGAVAAGTWQVNVKKAGRYAVYAYVDGKAGNLSTKAPYEVRADGKNTTVTVDQSKTGWIEIGKFEFAAGGDQWVKLTDATGEKFTNTSGKRVVFDALKFELAESCSDQCSTAGANECHGSGYRVCGDWNGDHCNEWSDDKPCGSGELCRDGGCYNPASDCEDECTEGSAECLPDGSGFRKCGQYDSDTCLDWSQTEYCGPSSRCENAVCVVNTAVECVQECTNGQKKCVDGGIVECGQFDDDECFEWSVRKDCESGATCVDGICKSQAVEPEKGEELPKACLTHISSKETIIDELDDCFVQSESSKWKKLDDYGYGDHLYYSYLSDDTASAVGTWYLNVVKSGRYEIAVYSEADIGGVADDALYEIRASGKTYHPSIIRNRDVKWQSLGNYELTAGEVQYIRLSDHTESDVNVGKRVLFDAIRVRPYEESAVVQPEPSEGKDSEVMLISESGCSQSGGNGGAMVWLLSLGGILMFGRMRRRRA